MGRARRTERMSRNPIAKRNASRFGVGVAVCDLDQIRCAEATLLTDVVCADSPPSTSSELVSLLQCRHQPHKRTSAARTIGSVGSRVLIGGSPKEV